VFTTAWKVHDIKGRLTHLSSCMHACAWHRYLYGVSPPDNDQVKEIRAIVMPPQVRGCVCRSVCICVCNIIGSSWSQAVSCWCVSCCCVVLCAVGEPQERDAARQVPRERGAQGPYTHAHTHTQSMAREVPLKHARHIGQGRVGSMLTHVCCVASVCAPTHPTGPGASGVDPHAAQRAAAAAAPRPHRARTHGTYARTHH
jgi:hypothetical protein